MIEVYLYGRLRRYGPAGDPTTECVLLAEAGEEHPTVGDLIASLGIPPLEVASVFRDGHWMREGLEASPGGARRLGLFPPNMSLLYV
ncbi:MAG: hypothetical protein M1380_01790 [Chloroflexi bacterium]|nr:hypothetical protein [Chloroflexota bacterium]